MNFRIVLLHLASLALVAISAGNDTCDMYRSLEKITLKKCGDDTECKIHACDACEGTASICFQPRAPKFVINCHICHKLCNLMWQKIERRSNYSKQIWQTQVRCRVQGEIIMREMCRVLRFECRKGTWITEDNMFNMLDGYVRPGTEMAAVRNHHS